MHLFFSWLAWFIDFTDPLPPLQKTALSFIDFSLLFSIFNLWISALVFIIHFLLLALGLNFLSLKKKNNLVIDFRSFHFLTYAFNTKSL